MSIATRKALRGGYCEFVGGFVRDWIIRREVDSISSALHDIDLRA